MCKLNENEAYIFLKWRIEQDNYRGIHFFQHHRQNSTKLEHFFNSLKCVLDDHKITKIEIPRGDDGKDYNPNDKKYSYFFEFLNKYKNQIRSGTSNSIRKNVLPDYERVLIIKRTKLSDQSFLAFNDFFLKKYKQDIENEKWNEIFRSVFYNYLEKKKFNDKLREIICALDYSLSLNEFQFFVTWLDHKYKNKNCDVKFIISLIQKWRKILKLQREEIVNELKIIANPANKKGKKQKKDFNNWRNESQQILKFYKEACIWSLDNEYNLKINQEAGVIIKRNPKIKDEYLSFNKVKKKVGFEFDHIVKFSRQTKIEDIALIENKLNLLYIDGKKHAIKTQRKNIFEKIIKIENDKIYLSSIMENIENYEVAEKLKLKIGENVLIDKNNLKDYENHNKLIINTLNKINS